MSLKLPINIDDKLIPISYAELVQAEAAYEAEQTKVAMAEQALHETSARYAAKEEELNLALAAQGALVLRLQEELKNIPPVVLPVVHKPTITKTELLNVAGVAIPKDNAPSITQDQNARDMMLIASLMGLNAWRGFFNLQEIVKHAAMSETNTNHLPGFGRRLGLTFIADTMNNHAVNLNDTDLKICLDGLRKMSGTGPFAGVFDDANQYRETRNTDGTLKYPAGTLERLVGRIRHFAPDMILIASLTANATIGEYKPLFDFVEAQTFGTIRELPVFLGRFFDVYCLDGRKEISVEYLTQAIEIVASKPPKNLFFYVSAITDWKNMASQIPLMRTLVQRWMSMAR
jgi:hypothetical protein